MMRNRYVYRHIEIGVEKSTFWREKTWNFYKIKQMQIQAGRLCASL